LQQQQYKIILCDYINPKSDSKCQFIQNAAVVLRRKSSNKYVVDSVGKRETVLKKMAGKKSKEVIDRRTMIMLPAFLDLHFHWVQDEVSLMPKNVLMTWLNRYTWPYERKFEKAAFARKAAKLFAQKLLAVGTMGGGCYASIHQASVNWAMKYFVGDFFIGNVLMTVNSPSYITQTAQAAKKLVAGMLKKYKGRYVVTPRFAITTDPATMKDVAAQARHYSAFIQTHISENYQEIEYTKHLYQNQKGFSKAYDSYAKIYDHCNILTPKTILAHAIHVDEEELRLLKKRRVSIAHCPTSNAPIEQKGLGSGVMDFSSLDRLKIPWGLASDIGGGPYLSMFDVMRSFLVQNMQKKEATAIKALYRATLANAKILRIDKKTGNLERGKQANFILIKYPSKSRPQKAEQLLKNILLVKESRRKNFMNIVCESYYQGLNLFSSKQ